VWKEAEKMKAAAEKRIAPLELVAAALTRLDAAATAAAAAAEQPRRDAAAIAAEPPPSAD